jgi:transcription initiation factor TFIIF subunit alpha
MPLKSQPGSPRDGTPSGTPSASRAGSPAPATLPTLDEVKAAIPKEGIAITTLWKLFKGRVFKEQSHSFISLVKQAGKQDPITKMIHPKKD